MVPIQVFLLITWISSLQVVQFYCWKASTLQTSKIQIDTGKVVELSQSQMEKINRLNPVFSKDNQLAETVLNCMTCENRQHFLDWANFASSVSLWRDYASKLHEELVRSLPFWKTHQSIFGVQFNGAWEGTHTFFSLLPLEMHESGNLICSNSLPSVSSFSYGFWSAAKSNRQFWCTFLVSASAPAAFI